jgi:hypothetical protein
MSLPNLFGIIDSCLPDPLSMICLNTDSNLNELERKKSFFLPPIRLINFKNFRNLKSYPRYPDHAYMTTTLDNVDRNSSFIVFISHCWLRNYPSSKGYDRFPHPDDLENHQFKLCVEGIEKAWNIFAPGYTNVFIGLSMIRMKALRMYCDSFFWRFALKLHMYMSFR